MTIKATFLGNSGASFDSKRFVLTGQTISSGAAINTGQTSEPNFIEVKNSSGQLISKFLPAAIISQPGGTGTNYYITYTGIFSPVSNAKISFII